MNSNRRTALRRARQQARLNSLTPQQRKGHPVAAEQFVRFGKRPFEAYVAQWKAGV